MAGSKQLSQYDCIGDVDFGTVAVNFNVAPGCTTFELGDTVMANCAARADGNSSAASAIDFLSAIMGHLGVAV
jgi:hypothetical protein